jgi:uncharacterized iron-regulated membrane protein
MSSLRFYRPPAAWIMAMMRAHGVLGVAFGGLVYLLCLTGTLAVFDQELEQWEYPMIQTHGGLSPGIADRVVKRIWAEASDGPVSVRIMMSQPPPGPMVLLRGSRKSWINSDASLYRPLSYPGWTQLLREVHGHLGLPRITGTILVGIAGVILCALVLSGAGAYARMLKGAFTWHPGPAPGAVNRAELHSRIGFWGAPFFFVIALSGTFFGSYFLFAATAAPLFNLSGMREVMGAVYGSPPEVASPQGEPEPGAAFLTLFRKEPSAVPVYFSGTRDRAGRTYMEIGVSRPGSLIWADVYRFGPDGSFLGAAGPEPAGPGRQLAASMFRLHMGRFGGFPVKLAYGLLGLAMTVSAATGVKIWLDRRPAYTSHLNNLWTAVVWGLPAALAVSAWLSLAGVAPAPVFWAAWGLSAVLCLLAGRTGRAGTLLRGLVALFCVAALCTQLARSLLCGATVAGIGVNTALALLVLGLIIPQLAFKAGGE